MGLLSKRDLYRRIFRRMTQSTVVHNQRPRQENKLFGMLKSTPTILDTNAFNCLFTASLFATIFSCMLGGSAENWKLKWCCHGGCLLTIRHIQMRGRHDYVSATARFLFQLRRCFLPRPNIPPRIAPRDRGPGIHDLGSKIQDPEART